MNTCQPCSAKSETLNLYYIPWMIDFYLHRGCMNLKLSLLSRQYIPMNTPVTLRYGTGGTNLNPSPQGGIRKKELLLLVIV